MSKEEIMFLLGKLMFTLNGTELLTEVTDALNELLKYKQMDNSNPNEALECLEEVKGYRTGGINSVEVYLEETENYDVIKKTLIKEQELEKENEILKGQMKYLTEVVTEFQKILKIIKEKNVDIWLLKSCLTLELYNFSITKMDNCKVFNLTQEEFDTLKRWLENDKTDK